MSSQEIFDIVVIGAGPEVMLPLLEQQTLGKSCINRQDKNWWDA